MKILTITNDQKRYSARFARAEGEVVACDWKWTPYDPSLKTSGPRPSTGFSDGRAVKLTEEESDALVEAEGRV